MPGSHGVLTAWYQGKPGDPDYKPVLECICGWQTLKMPNWTLAGTLMDEHLRTGEKLTETEQECLTKP